MHSPNPKPQRAEAQKDPPLVAGRGAILHPQWGLNAARLASDCRGSHRPSPARTSPIYLGGLLAAGWAGDIWCERVGQEEVRPPSVPPLPVHPFSVTFDLEQMAEVGVAQLASQATTPMKFPIKGGIEEVTCLGGG